MELYRISYSGLVSFPKAFCIIKVKQIKFILFFKQQKSIDDDDDDDDDEL